MTCKIGPKSLYFGYGFSEWMTHYQVQVWLQKWESVKTFETRMDTIRFDDNKQLSKEDADKRQQVSTMLHPRYQFRVVAIDEDFNLL